jgi:hypothetical protein
MGIFEARIFFVLVCARIRWRTKIFFFSLGSVVIANDEKKNPVENGKKNASVSIGKEEFYASTWGSLTWKWEKMFP